MYEQSAVAMVRGAWLFSLVINVLKSDHARPLGEFRSVLVSHFDYFTVFVALFLYTFRLALFTIVIVIRFGDEKIITISFHSNNFFTRRSEWVHNIACCFSWMVGKKEHLKVWINWENRVTRRIIKKCSVSVLLCVCSVVIFISNLAHLSVSWTIALTRRYDFSLSIFIFYLFLSFIRDRWAAVVWFKRHGKESTRSDQCWLERNKCGTI